MLAIRQAQERLQRLEQAIAAAVPDWSLAPLVTALMAMRGMDLISATTLLAEIGDLSRFQTPTELMAYLGLVPSEDSTGDTVKRGPITKAGNRAPGACWWSARGAISIRRGSDKPSNRRSMRRRLRFARLPGRRNADCSRAIAADQERQAQDRRHRRDRARARRLHLGCRSRSHDRTCRGRSGLRGLARGAKRQGP